MSDVAVSDVAVGGAIVFDVATNGTVTVSTQLLDVVDLEDLAMGDVQIQDGLG